MILPVHNPTPGWERYASERISSLLLEWEKQDGTPLDIDLYIVPDASLVGHTEEVCLFWRQHPYKTLYIDYSNNKGKDGTIRTEWKILPHHM